MGGLKDRFLVTGTNVISGWNSIPKPRQNIVITYTIGIRLYEAVTHNATWSLYPLLFCRQSVLQILLIFCGVAVMALLSAIVGWAWRKFWDAACQTPTLHNPGKSYSTPTTLICYFCFMETSFWFTFTAFWYDQLCHITSKGRRAVLYGWLKRGSADNTVFLWTIWIALNGLSKKIWGLLNGHQLPNGLMGWSNIHVLHMYLQTYT